MKDKPSTCTYNELAQALEGESQCLKEELSHIRAITSDHVEADALKHVNRLKNEFRHASMADFIDSVAASRDACPKSERPSQQVLLKTEREVRLAITQHHLDAKVLSVTRRRVSFEAPVLERVPSVPKGYAYKGGAARLALAAVLGEDIGRRAARDLDLVRIGSQEDELDRRLAEKIMPDDFQHGNGIEIAASVSEYFSSRDIRINEILYFHDRVVCSFHALQDHLNQVLQPTGHILRGDNPSLGRIIAKMLRFAAEARMEGKEFQLEGIPHNVQVSAFDIALHLDRALTRGTRTGELFLKECIDQGYLCEHSTRSGSIRETIDHLRAQVKGKLRQFQHLTLEADLVAKPKIRRGLHPKRKVASSQTRKRA